MRHNSVHDCDQQCDWTVGTWEEKDRDRQEGDVEGLCGQASMNGQRHEAISVSCERPPKSGLSGGFQGSSGQDDSL